LLLPASQGHGLAMAMKKSIMAVMPHTPIET